MTKNKLNGTRHTQGTKRVEDANAPTTQSTMDRPQPGEPAAGGEPRKTFALGNDPEALRRGVAGILVEFVRAVEPHDFCAFVYILAHGSLSSAAQALGTGRTTLFRRVESWATRGPDYQRMLKLLPCRNSGVTPERVPLVATVESGERNEQAENPETVGAMLEQIEAAADMQRDYPALLRDLHGALQAMNSRNWEAVRGELLTVIAEEIRDSH